MKKETTIVITVMIIVVIVVAGAGAYIYFFNNQVEIEITNFKECEEAGYPIMESYPRQCSANGQVFIEEIDNADDANANGEIPEDVKDYFVEELREKGVENLGAMPIEGFDPQLYKGAFPDLIDKDFDGVDAISGKWELQGNELVFVRDENGYVTSADGTLTDEGVKELLENLDERLNLDIQKKEDIDSLIENISKN